MADAQAIPVESFEAAINRIRLVRDTTCTRLLKGDGLDEFLETHFSVFVISNVKREFICRDLQNLKDSPLDLAYYAELIKAVKADSQYQIDAHQLILGELFRIMSKYGLDK